MQEFGIVLLTNFDKLRENLGQELFDSFLIIFDLLVDQRKKKYGYDRVQVIDTSVIKDNQSWRRIKEYLSGICNFDNFSTALILGGDAVIPFCIIPNSVENESIYSDSYYFDLNERADHFPKLSVGRLPNMRILPGRDLLLDLIQRIIDTEYSIEIDDRACITSETWHETSRDVFKLLDSRLATFLSSPPFGITKDENVRFVFSDDHLKDQSILYFNLHGEIEPPYWFGERRKTIVGDLLPMSSYNVAMTPSFVEECEPRNSIVVASVCHATAIIGKSYINNIALAFLKKRCLAVIGPSSIAYSYRVKRGSTENLTGINLLFYLLIQNLLTGKSLGESLRLAKIFYSAHNVFDDANILGTNLLGDPDLVFKYSKGMRGYHETR